MIFEEVNHRNKVISVKITEEEFKRINEMLKHYNVTKSIFLRALINNHYDNEFNKKE